jgi:hypothetical protein
MKKGVTLIEIIISTVLLAAVMVGLGGLFVGGQRILTHNQFRSSGGELGKYFLDPLHIDVKQSEWNDAAGDYIAANPLHIHPSAAAAAENIPQSTLRNTPFTPNYTVSAVPARPASQMRKVTVTVTWPEYE